MDAQLLREDLVKLKQRLLFGCRLCLDETELKVNLDSDAGNSSQKLYEIANHYMNLDVSPADEESTHACLSCAGKLIAFKQFYDACKATEKTIKAISNTIRIRKLMGDDFDGKETAAEAEVEVPRLNSSSPSVFSTSSLRCFECIATFSSASELEEHKRIVHGTVFAGIRPLAGHVVNPVATVAPLNVVLEEARESPPRTPPRLTPQPPPSPRAPEQREKPRRKLIFKCRRCPMKFDSKIVYNRHNCITVKLRPQNKTLIVSCHHCNFRSTRNIVAMHESVKHQTRHQIRVKGSKRRPPQPKQRSCGQKLSCIENGCSYNADRVDHLLEHLFGIHKHTRDQARQISRRTLFEAKRKQAMSRGVKHFPDWFECPICSSLYETSVALRSHVSRFHPEAPKVQQAAKNSDAERIYSCPICETKSKYPQSIQRHLIEVHGYTKDKAIMILGQLEGPTLDPTVGPTVGPTLDPTVDPTLIPTVGPTLSLAERTEDEINWSEMFLETEWGRFKCRFCRVLCLTESGCKNHIKQKHTDKFAPGQLFKCSQPSCPALFTNRFSIDRHEKICRFRNELGSK